MATITPVPIVLKNCVFRVYDVGSNTVFDDYAPAASKVQFTPSTSQQTFTAISGATYTSTSPATWVCDIEYAQDWASAKSLSKLLHDGEGTTRTVEFISSTGDPVWKATLSIAPGSVGGAGAAFATASVSLGCLGKPTRTP